MKIFHLEVVNGQLVIVIARRGMMRNTLAQIERSVSEGSAERASPSSPRPSGGARRIPKKA